MLEADLQRTVIDYLQYQENLGRLVYIRLNAGNFFVTDRKGKLRRVRGAKKGTADILILKRRKHAPSNDWRLRTIFVELKSAKGKQSEAQIEFQKMVTKQGASYYVVRDIETLEGILAG